MLRDNKSCLINLYINHRFVCHRGIIIMHQLSYLCDREEVGHALR